MKTEKVFLTTRDVRCVHHGWHGTHRCDIQVVATHADFVKKNFFSFRVALDSSIKVGPLAFLLWTLVITKNIMKHPVSTDI